MTSNSTPGNLPNNIKTLVLKNICTPTYIYCTLLKIAKLSTIRMESYAVQVTNGVMAKSGSHRVDWVHRSTQWSFTQSHVYN